MRIHHGLTLLIALALLLAASPAGAQATAEGFLRAAAADYRGQARYPTHSWALPSGQADPVAAERDPSPVTRRGPEGSGATLAVWAGAVSFEHPEPVDLYASLTLAGQAVAVDRLRGEVVTEAGELVGTFEYLDDGRGADRQAGDGVYSARLGWVRPPELADAYLVRVEAQGPQGLVLAAAGGFLYSRPWARLTGRYRDRLQDGNLVIAAEVEVTQAGRFHLAGTLAKVAGEPIGVAQNALAREPGRHWVELNFFGLMFHDRQAAGPYRLASLSLATTGGMPNALSRLVQNAHVTRPYRLRQLRSVPFGEPGLLAAAQGLELEAARAALEATQEGRRQQ